MRYTNAESPKFKMKQVHVHYAKGICININEIFKVKELYNNIIHAPTTSVCTGKRSLSCEVCIMMYIHNNTIHSIGGDQVAKRSPRVYHPYLTSHSGKATQNYYGCKLREGSATLHLLPHAFAMKNFSSMQSHTTATSEWYTLQPRLNCVPQTTKQ